MCFDCLLAFPPFSSSSNAGAKKALNKLSRPNTPAPTNTEDAYGPPLAYDLYQEELPDKEKDEIKAAPPLDDGFGEVDSGTFEHGSENSSMDPSTGMEADAVLLADMDHSGAVSNHKEESPSEEKYAYEHEIEIETSLDDQLPVGSGDETTSEVTNETTSTIEKPETDNHNVKELQVPGNIVGHLEINLEYDESTGRLKVAIMQASGLANKKVGGFNNYRVRLYLRPNKQQSSKTRIRPADSPVFRELFRFRQLPKDELAISELLFKMQGCGKYGKEKLVGDATLNLSALKAAAKQSFKIPLVGLQQK